MEREQYGSLDEYDFVIGRTAVIRAKFSPLVDASVAEHQDVKDWDGGTSAGARLLC